MDGVGLFGRALGATREAMPHLSEEACLGLLIMKTGSPSHRGAVIAALRVHEAIKCWSGAPSSSRARWGWVGSLGAVHIDIRV